jgi:AraC family transcriptional regulator
MNEAQRSVLFTSDYYSVVDFHSFCDTRTTFKVSVSESFCINFTRSGYLTFDAFKRTHDEYNTCILVEKPGCEFTLTQQNPGASTCTVFRFTEIAYEEILNRYRLKGTSFFSNPDLFSTLIFGTPEIEYLYNNIRQTIEKRNLDKLELDSLVMEMAGLVVSAIGGRSVNILPENQKKNHFRTIERAKEYIMENFTSDISLHDLAKYCHVSPFHFSRLFKQFSNYSPYQYLQHIRLKHAETLLKTTALPITDVCFRSGFNRLDYFSAAFTKKYTLSPSKYKLRIAS